MSVSSCPPWPCSKEDFSPLPGLPLLGLFSPFCPRDLATFFKPSSSQPSQKQTLLMEKTLPPPEFLGPALLLAHRAAALAAMGRSKQKTKTRDGSRKRGLWLARMRAGGLRVNTPRGPPVRVCECAHACGAYRGCMRGSARQRWGRPFLLLDLATAALVLFHPH